MLRRIKRQKGTVPSKKGTYKKEECKKSQERTTRRKKGTKQQWQRNIKSEERKVREGKFKNQTQKTENQ